MSDFMKVDMSRLGRADEGRTGEARAEAPAGADVDAFQKALRRDGVDEREARHSGKEASPDREKAGQDDAEAFSQVFSGMTNPLENLFAGRMGQPVSAEAAPADGPDPGALAEKLVERILVSEPGDGGSEIRITLGGDVLPGTEIRLLRGADGLLSVRLGTDDDASFQTLVGAQETLKAQLERVEKNGVRVDVVCERDGADAENGDTRRQSRGRYLDPEGRDA